MANPQERAEFFKMVLPFLAQTPFFTIQSSKDILFNLPPDASLAEEEAFLKNTKLCDLEFDNLDDLTDFTMRNTKTNETIKVSNRATSASEIRGQILRDNLIERRKNNPDETVHDAISALVKDPLHSGMVGYIKIGCQSFGIDLTPRAIQIFADLIVAEINKKISSGEINGPINPKDVLNNEGGITDQLIKGIDKENLFNQAIELDKCLSEFEALIVELEQHCQKLESESGSLLVHHQTQTLLDQLKNKKEEFDTHKISATDFVVSATKITKDFQANNKPSGVLNQILNSFAALLKKISQIFAPVKPISEFRDTMQKMRKNSLASAADQEKVADSIKTPNMNTPE